MKAARHTLVAALVICLPAAAAAEDYAPEVYRDPHLAVHAGVTDAAGSEIVHLGDLLSLVVEVSWDPQAREVATPDADFFTAPWAEGDGPKLVDFDVARTERGELGSWRAVYRFQILDCPGTDWSCPGNRSYPLPEFSVQVREAGTAASEPGVAVSFRPWPGELPVTSVIPLDDEGQLYVFEKYFPAGGYPAPARAGVATATAVAVAAGGALVLAGGVLMWPFHSRKRRTSVASSLPRWRQVLNDIADETDAGEALTLDRLRRAVVWYLSDELGIDAFDWLDTDAASEPHEELHALFLELLQAPSGQAGDLHARFEALVAEQPGR